MLPDKHEQKTNIKIKIYFLNFTTKLHTCIQTQTVLDPLRDVIVFFHHPEVSFVTMVIVQHDFITRWR